MNNLAGNVEIQSRRVNQLNLLSIPSVEKITREDFQASYMEPNCPVVIKDLASSWPALKKWTPEYLEDQFGELEVNVYNVSFVQPGKHYMASLRKMPFREYLALIRTSSMDLRLFLFNLLREAPQLRDDIKFPSVAKGYSKRFVFMFFGCRSSFTPIHYDIDLSHIFHTVIYGKKRVVLFPPEESRNVYKHPFSTRSYLDVNHPDFDKFPRLSDATGYQATVHAGETLFIPSGYWHHVVYEDGGYGISIRCRHQLLSKRLQGYVNILVCLPIDKVMNKFFPDRWFRWKEKKSRS